MKIGILLAKYFKEQTNNYKSAYITANVQPFSAVNYAAGQTNATKYEGRDFLTIPILHKP